MLIYACNSPMRSAACADGDTGDTKMVLGNRMAKTTNTVNPKIDTNSVYALSTNKVTTETTQAPKSPERYDV